MLKCTQSMFVCVCFHVVQDFTYLTVPMYDDPSETFKTHYSKCREFITKARADGGTVLVHW